MFDCPINPGVSADRCKDCTLHCGFVPEEIARRKKRINEGLGLTVNALGLRCLKIGKERK